MGKFKFKLKCPQVKEEEEAKERPLLQDPSQDQPRLDFSSQLEELPDTSETQELPPELEPVPQSTWPPSSNTSPLRFSSSQETPPRTTREAESCPDTSSSPSETTRSSTDSWDPAPSPPVESSP